jgi:hypothetical protein
VISRASERIDAVLCLLIRTRALGASRAESASDL